MISPATIKERLNSVFKPAQANVLTEIFSESYTDLVKTGDFKELKSIVQELADAQRRTESKVEDLAEAQKRTEIELRNLARQVGGLSEAFGGSLEDFALDLVPELLEKSWNLKIEDVGRDEFTINKKTVELDLVIRGNREGNPIIVLGEVKSNLTAFEVDKFLSTTKEIVNFNTEEFSGKEVRVIFFGNRANLEARELVKEKGAYMIFTHGKIL
jgi:predicted nuclease with TOPRIM domain